MTAVMIQLGCRPVSAILIGLLAWSATLWGQGAPQVTVSPSVVNLLIGQTQRLRLVDPTGQMQHNVSWAISEMGGLDSQTGDELVVTARHAGVFKVTGAVNGVSADAVVRVLEGNALPQGINKWSDTEPPGCKLVKTVPATPGDGGADMLALSTCADGSYVSGFTKDGIELWRHKNGSPAVPGQGQGMSAAAPAGQTNNSAASTHLDLNSSSVCDVLTIGTEQEKARELLKSNNRSFSTEGANGQIWVVDETGSECRLWFDDKSVLVKKRKTLTAE